MSNKTEAGTVACPHVDDPRGCYRVRCQLGRKCVEPVKPAAHPPAQEQPAPGGMPNGYEAMTTCYKRYVSPAQYAAFSPAVQKWYRPFWTATHPTPAERAEQPRGIEAERAEFSEWIATAVPFDANVGMVEHSMKTDAAWQGWMARAAAQDFREVLPASMASPAGRHPKLPLLPPDDETLPARLLKLAEQIDTEEVCGHVVAQQLREMTKAERVHALVNDGPWHGMSEAFDAHMGAACWTDPAYRQDAATWAAAWKASKRAEQPRDPHRGGGSYEASMLRNLLARIHGDGGHYVEQHGLEKALEDADLLVAAWRAEQPPRDAVQQGLDALYRLDDYIARINGDDRGSCADINTIRATLNGQP